MRPHFGTVALCAALVGCGTDRPVAPPVTPTDTVSDPDKVRATDYSVLFVGNSHTRGHDLPNLVCEVIRFRQAGKSTLTRPSNWSTRSKSGIRFQKV